QRGTHGRSGRRLSRGQLQRNYGLDLLCHYISSVERVVDQTIRCTCRKSSSTGVSRPKKDTSTRTLPFSGLMSSTTPMKSVNGPSTTLTRSPLVKLTLTLGGSWPIFLRIFLTSSS